MNRRDYLKFLSVNINLLQNRITLNSLLKSTEREYDRQMKSLYRPSAPFMREVKSYQGWNIFQIRRLKEQARQDYEEALVVYERRLDDYNRKYKSIPERYKLIIASINEKRQEVSDIIDQCREMGIINQYYYNLPALCKFYEYFSKELVDTPKEAYRRYEDDKKYENLICKMDEVLDSLNQIREEQEELYDAICEVRSSIDYMGNSISCLMSDVRYMQLTAFNQSMQNTWDSLNLQSIRDDVKKLTDQIY